jgi:hypothetical protein
MTGIWLLQVVDTTEGMVNIPFLSALKTEKRHMLYIIGWQKNSLLKSGGVAAENDLNRYCSYSGNINVYISKEIIL